MTGLAELLEREAARLEPHRSLADVHVRVRRRRRRRRSASVVAAVVAVLLVGAGLSVSRRRPSLDPSSLPLTRLAALTIRDRPDDAAVGALDRHDPDALSGPWTVVVRAADGSLGWHSAVVSYPVPTPPLAEHVSIGGVDGVATDDQVVWTLDGQSARVRGDLPRDQLVAIAAATSIVDDRPVVAAVAGLSVGPARPYRAPDVHEVRLHHEPLGFVYTGVQVGGGFEDQVFATHGRTGYTVQGHPAVISAVEGGNGTVAWEPSPGVVAYVGYSGGQLDDPAVAALVEVAERSEPLDLDAWTALQPQTVVQHNGPADM